MIQQPENKKRPPLLRDERLYTRGATLVRRPAGTKKTRHESAFVASQPHSLRVRPCGDTLRPDNGGVSVPAYWGTNDYVTKTPFGGRLPGPFNVCAGAGFSPLSGSLEPRFDVYFSCSQPLTFEF